MRLSNQKRDEENSDTLFEKERDLLLLLLILLFKCQSVSLFLVCKEYKKT
jgi:predicted HTH domain antitoxin